MLTGKFWITPHGLVDVTRSEHALYAKNYLLKLLGTPAEFRLTKDLFEPLSKREVARHRRRGISERVLNFLRQPTINSNGATDSRVFAIKYLKWIRVRESGFYVWRFDEKALNSIRNARDYWKTQTSCTLTQQVLVHEIATRNSFSTSISLLLNRKANLSRLRQCPVTECA